MGDKVKVDVKKIDGSNSGEQVELPEEIFGIEPNDHAIWQAVTAQLNNSRQGTVMTKNRSRVSGGGKKPWRQKGRGTARAGTIRSPLWVGGGRVFGPQPRNYHTALNKKIKRLARLSALSYKAKDEKIHFVEDFSFDVPKTRQMTELLKSFGLDQTKTLLVLAEGSKAIWLSGRNIQRLAVREADGFSTYDIMNAEALLIQKSALAKIKEVLVK